MGNDTFWLGKNTQSFVVFNKTLRWLKLVFTQAEVLFEK